MRITPIEIQQHQFKARLFGYDTRQVDQFLEFLADELESQQRQNIELKESLARAKSTMEELREREKSLQQTLMTAQQMADELRDGARKDGELIVANAHLESERVVRDANYQRLQLLSEIQDIRRQKLSFQQSLRALVESHLKLMDLDHPSLPEEEQSQPLLQDPMSDSEAAAKTRFEPE